MAILLATRVRQQREREQARQAQDIIALQQFTQQQQQLQAANQRLSALQALPLEQRQQFAGAVPNFPAARPFPTARSRGGAQLFSEFLLNRQQQQARQRLQATKPIPRETVANIRAEQIRRLQAIPEEQITQSQSQSLKRLLEGQAQVQVTIGEKDIRRDTLSERKNFAADPRVKDIRIIEKFTQNVVTAFNRSLTSKNLGPIDIALAKSFQKLTDLGSSVREGEFATTFEGQSLINKIRGKFDSIVKGGLGFTEEERREIRDLVLVLQKDSQKLFNQALDEFSVTADELGLNKRAIFGGREKFDVPVDINKPIGLSRQELTPAEESRRQELLRKASQ